MRPVFSAPPFLLAIAFILLALALALIVTPTAAKPQKQPAVLVTALYDAVERRYMAVSVTPFFRMRDCVTALDRVAQVTSIYPPEDQRVVGGCFVRDTAIRIETLLPISP